MNDLYFLFGKQISDIYNDGSITDVVLAIQNQGVDHALFVWKEDTDPTELLNAYEGWEGWVVISKAEYDKIKDL